uniref:Uncharacterized protein n=1 Tax=Cucumis melo TaxID=3656 RepID=A0A9I9EI35_CUCME
MSLGHSCRSSAQASNLSRDADDPDARRPSRRRPPKTTPHENTRRAKTPPPPPPPPPPKTTPPERLPPETPPPEHACRAKTCANVPFSTLVILHQLFGHQSARFRAFSLAIVLERLELETFVVD